MTALAAASGPVNDTLRRLVARLLPWWDDSARKRRSEEVLRKADLTLERHDAFLSASRRAAERYRR